MLHYDHYSFPYRDNNAVQQELTQNRLYNLEKRRQIRQLELQVK